VLNDVELGSILPRPLRISIDLSQEVSFFSIFSRPGQGSETGPLNDLSEPLAFEAVGQVMIKTSAYQGHGTLDGVDMGQLLCQPRVTAQLSTHQDPISFSPFYQGPGGACPYALPAGKTCRLVQDRPVLPELDGPFPARLNTRAALGARRIRHKRYAGADQAQVNNLRPGARVWAVGDGNTEFVMHFERSANTFLEKILQGPGRQLLLNPSGDDVIRAGPIGASRRPKAGLYLVPADFILHPVEEPLLTGPNMGDGDTL
jgi:hypothetical protein